MATGVFDERLKAYYGAAIGGYTSVTETEVNKQTYNVKACIRKILINKLGRENIPKHTEKKAMPFKLADHIPAEYGDQLALICKFSKPSGDEMTIYLPRKGFISRLVPAEGDVWCIYFKENDPQPWFDFIKKEKWDVLCNDRIGGLIVEPDELQQKKTGKIADLSYTYSVSELSIQEISPPETLDMQEKNGGKTAHVISTDDMKQIQKNQKIKGNRGEELVVRIEKERLIAAGRNDLANLVSWISKDYDGYGYDIESFDQDPESFEWKPIYIEVKATSQSNATAPFYISENERRVSAEKGATYYIYRVFAMTTGSRDVSYYRIGGPVEENFVLVPSTYVAKIK